MTERLDKNNNNDNKTSTCENQSREGNKNSGFQSNPKV